MTNSTWTPTTAVHWWSEVSNEPMTHFPAIRVTWEVLLEDTHESVHKCSPFADSPRNIAQRRRRREEPDAQLKLGSHHHCWWSEVFNEPFAALGEWGGKTRHRYPIKFWLQQSIWGEEETERTLITNYVVVSDPTAQVMRHATYLCITPYPCWYFYRTQVSLVRSMGPSLSQWATFADLIDVTLADEDSNSIPTDDVNRAIKAMWQCKWRHLVAK